MTSDYKLEIRPNGGQVQVILTGGRLPQLGNRFDRPFPVLNAASIDSFRRGEVQEAEVDQLSLDVSTWLLSNDLIRDVIQWLRDDQRLRFTFAVDTELQERFDQVPFELLRTAPGLDPLVIHAKVDSFVHLLPQVGNPPAVASTLDWPMRVLLVRSNPADLGGRVPPAVPIRDEIVALGAQEFGQGNVEIDLLTTEPGANALGPPTWQRLQRAVRRDYHVLVYLGHGDIKKPYQDKPAVSQLKLESDDPLAHEPVSSRQLANLLNRNPIPVVVLAGCLTAAAPGAGPLPDLPAWMRGNQGMAQALVNSESGVLFAVGMRCQIDQKYAVLFLKEFFESLFRDEKGNVEAAVRAARGKLFLQNPTVPYWAGPMAFSNPLSREPLFEYLSRMQSKFEMTDVLKRDLDARKVLWKLMADLPRAGRPQSLTDAMQENRDAIQAEVLKQGAMLIPELAEAAPGAAGTISVRLEGVLAFKRFQAKLSVAPGLTVTGAHAAKPLTDAGYQLLMDAHEPAAFQIQVRPGAVAPQQVPTGAIVLVDVQASPEAAGVIPVTLDVVETDAAQRFWPGNSAVVVTPP